MTLSKRSLPRDDLACGSRRPFHGYKPLEGMWKYFSRLRTCTMLRFSNDQSHGIRLYFRSTVRKWCSDKNVARCFYQIFCKERRGGEHVDISRFFAIIELYACKRFVKEHNALYHANWITTAEFVMIYTCKNIECFLYLCFKSFRQIVLPDILTHV